MRVSLPPWNVDLHPFLPRPLPFPPPSQKKNVDLSHHPVKVHFSYSTQKYGDSIRRYFPFSKRKSPSKIECCVQIMHWGFSGSFPGSTIFICKFKTDQSFFFLETVLVSELETFEKCKEDKHIMITIIAVVYIFYLLWYFMSSWKLLAENTQASSDKIHCPIFTHCPHKNTKSASPPILPT